MRRIAVLGAGAFGTALGVVQAAEGRDVRLWGRNAAALAAGRENPRLPGVPLPPGLAPAATLDALAEAEVALVTVPAQQTGALLAEHAAFLPRVPLVLCAKGIDGHGFALQTEIAAAAAPRHPLAVLTGPGFAGEIARGLPTALTLACADADLGRRLQAALAAPRLRLYLTEDVVGAQLGGALKNVIAIACGLVEGAGLGQSARAAVMTRGFAEMTRLAVAMGARAETLAGLSGLGDLALTCASAQSRNFALGEAMGAGRVRPAGTEGIPAGTGKGIPTGTVEGVATARAACQLGARHGVEVPLAAAVADVLDARLTLDEAMEALLSRPLREE